MNISTSTLTNPANRAGLEQYYEKMKADAVAAWDARPPAPDTFSFTAPDGEVRTGKVIQVTGEQAAKAFVSFDRWLGFMTEAADFRAQTLAMAEEQMKRVEAGNPANSSTVRATYSVGDTLLAYINADGTLVTSNGAQDMLGDLQGEADAAGLKGDARIAFFNSRITAVLSELHPKLEINRYDDASSPSLGAFADRWYQNYDAEAIYKEALGEAQTRLDELRAQQAQWQDRLYDIQGFLMQTQAAN